MWCKGACTGSGTAWFATPSPCTLAAIPLGLPMLFEQEVQLINTRLTMDTGSSGCSIAWAGPNSGVVSRSNKKPGDYVPKGATLATVRSAPDGFAFDEISAVPSEHLDSATKEWTAQAVKSASAGKLISAPQVSHFAGSRATILNIATPVLQLWHILPQGQSSVWVVAACDHPRSFGDLCTVCGNSVDASGSSTASALGGTKRNAEGAITANPVEKMTFQARQGYQLSLSVLEAAKLDARKHARLRASRRLNLTLDLDHTLIHSTNDQQYHHLVGHSALAEAPLHSFMLSGRRYFTKERPGLKAFLSAAKEHFELHVDTAGTRPYAEQIVAAIDPQGEFFGSPPRIVARTDSGKLSKQTSWLHGSLLDDSMVMVLDDTEAVWKGSPVLLLVDPYHYFQGTKEVNNAAGASVAVPGEEGGGGAAAGGDADCVPQPHGQEEEHLHLLDALRVFNTVHKAYFSCYGVEVPASKYRHGVVTHALDGAIAAGMDGVQAVEDMGGVVSPAAADAQRLVSADHMMHAAYLMQRFCQTILRGVVIVFSGVFPLGTKAHREMLYRRAVAYGATVADVVSDKTTHVVCRAWGTAKTAQAGKLKTVRVVRTAWLQDCIRQYRRVPEGTYVFPEAKAAGCGSKPHPHAASSAARADAHFNKYFSSMLQGWRNKQAQNLRPPSPMAVVGGDSKRSRFAEGGGADSPGYGSQGGDNSSGEGSEIDMDFLGDALGDSGDEDSNGDGLGEDGAEGLGGAASNDGGTAESAYDVQDGGFGPDSSALDACSGGEGGCSGGSHWLLRDDMQDGEEEGNVGDGEDWGDEGGDDDAY